MKREQRRKQIEQICVEQMQSEQNGKTRTRAICVCVAMITRNWYDRTTINYWHWTCSMLIILYNFCRELDDVCGTLSLSFLLQPHIRTTAYRHARLRHTRQRTPAAVCVRAPLRCMDLVDFILLHCSRSYLCIRGGLRISFSRLFWFHIAHPRHRINSRRKLTRRNEGGWVYIHVSNLCAMILPMEEATKPVTYTLTLYIHNSTHSKSKRIDAFRTCSQREAEYWAGVACRIDALPGLFWIKHTHTQTQSLLWIRADGSIHFISCK